MLKLIQDLTNEEIDEICVKHRKVDGCRQCPLITAKFDGTFNWGVCKRESPQLHARELIDTEE